MPRAPLQPGSRYAVSITANDVTYAWSFTAAETSATTFTTIAKLSDGRTDRDLSMPTPPSRVEPHVRRVARPACPEPHWRRSTSESAEYAATVAGADSAAAAETTRGATSSGTNWLTTLNLYRAPLKLQPVEEDPGSSQGCMDHAKYLVTNYESMLARGINIPAA